MIPGRYTLTIFQGASLSLPLVWKDSAGVVVNITGYTARLHVRQSIEDVATLLTLTTENGGIVVDGPAGKITLTMTAAATAALTFTSGVYDLELIAAGGVVSRLLMGKVKVDREVTR